MKIWCNRCGLCCRPFPSILDLHNVSEDDRKILQMNDQGFCIHLNDDKECNIYEDRPTICRAGFGWKANEMSESEYIRKSRLACLNLQLQEKINNSSKREKK